MSDHFDDEFSAASDGEWLLHPWRLDGDGQPERRRVPEWWNDAPGSLLPWQREERKALNRWLLQAPPPGLGGLIEAATASIVRGGGARWAVVLQSSCERLVFHPVHRLYGYEFKLPEGWQLFRQDDTLRGAMFAPDGGELDALRESFPAAACVVVTDNRLEVPAELSSRPWLVCAVPRLARDFPSVEAQWRAAVKRARAAGVGEAAERRRKAERREALEAAQARKASLRAERRMWADEERRFRAAFGQDGLPLSRSKKPWPKEG